MAKLGEGIHTANRGPIGLSFVEMLIAVFDAKQAGDARRDFLKKVMSGKIDKVGRGLVVGSKQPRYGCAFVRNDQGRIVEYVIDDEQAKIVRLIFHQRRLEFEAKIAKQDLDEESVDTVLKFAAAVSKGMREDEFEMKRLMLDVLKVEVAIRGEDYTVSSLITGWSGKIIRRAGCKRRVMNPGDIPEFCRDLPLYKDVLGENSG